MGDIPMNEALQGLDNLTPAYDSQKDIFKQAFDWLESANTDLAHFRLPKTTCREIFIWTMIWKNGKKLLILFV